MGTEPEIATDARGSEARSLNQTQASGDEPVEKREPSSSVAAPLAPPTLRPTNRSVTDLYEERIRGIWQAVFRRFPDLAREAEAEDWNTVRDAVAAAGFLPMVAEAVSKGLTHTQ